MIFRDDMIDLEGQAVAFLRNLAVFAAMTGSLPYQFLQRAFHRAHCARGFFPSTRRFLSDRRAFDPIVNSEEVAWPLPKAFPSVYGF